MKIVPLMKGQCYRVIGGDTDSLWVLIEPTWQCPHEEAILSAADLMVVIESKIEKFGTFQERWKKYCNKPPPSKYRVCFSLGQIPTPLPPLLCEKKSESE